MNSTTSHCVDALATVVTPIIHLNGDRKETLLDNLLVAYKALRAAKLALQQYVPNARNYRTGCHMREARAQHLARLGALEAIMASLEAEATGIQRAYPC